MPRRASLVLLLVLAADPIRAEEIPLTCIPAREGMVACLGGALCACRLERGGQFSGRADHFVWDCGVLRPVCPAPGAAPPAAALPWPPPGVWVAPGPPPQGLR